MGSQTLSVKAHGHAAAGFPNGGQKKQRRHQAGFVRRAAPYAVLTAGKRLVGTGGDAYFKSGFQFFRQERKIPVLMFTFENRVDRFPGILTGKIPVMFHIFGTD